MAEENAYEKFTKREWAMALVGLTPSGREFLTPNECASYVRKSRNFPPIIIELREQNATYRELLESVLERFDVEGYESRWCDKIGAALAKEPR